MYSSSFPTKTDGEILDCDARKLPLNYDSVDAIVSSPPYYSTIDYVDSNRLRLAILGVDEQKALKSQLIQQANTYIENMKVVGSELWRVLKPKALCVLVLGDFPKTKMVVNTADEINKIFSKEGFVTKAIVADEIPIMKRTVVKWVGTESLKTYPKKYDRILVMQAEK
jgi:DNA modification methylase